MNNWQDNIHALENLDEDGGDDLTLSEEVEEFRRRQERREKQRAGREKKRAQKLLLKEQKKQEEQKRRIEAEKAALSLREEGARKLTRAEKKLAKKALKRQRRESGETREKRAGVVRRILGFVEVTQKDHIPAYATEAAFFLIMSFIPFLLFMITLIRHTALSYNALRTAIITVVPENFQSFVLEIVVDVYRRNSAVAPISALAMLWAAGKGVQAITNGLNVIYHVKE
ncbi:MAG: YihY/virulence factor BrkB family protein, partial [Blautia sp.]|nr:YihY/virulence factor BrkB family protein [Blautia sp.]